MRRARTPRLAIYGIAAAVGVLGGLGLGRPELLAVAAGPLLLVAVGAARTRRLDPGVEVAIDRERAIEGELVGVDVTVTSPVPVDALQVGLALPDGLGIERVEDPDSGTEHVSEAGATVVRLDGPRRVRFAVACDAWGAYGGGRVELSHSEGSGLFRHHRTVPFAFDLKVFPPELGLRSLLEPAATQANLGELVSRRAGEGIEFADLRPFTPGDDARRVNWRASARRGHLWVNERHPERNSDIVLVIDPLSGLRVDTADVLDYAVRAAASVAAGHLGRRDRVGLLLIGGSMIWLRPRMFDLQRHRILDALAMSRLRFGDGPQPVAVAHRLLPPNALLIGLSPLLDEQAVEVFEDLAGRGYDMALVEIDTHARLSPPRDDDQRLARRIWLLERESTRTRFRRRGIALATWDVRHPFEEALEEVISFRRASRRVRR